MCMYRRDLLVDLKLSENATLPGNVRKDSGEEMRDVDWREGALVGDWSGAESQTEGQIQTVGDEGTRC